MAHMVHCVKLNKEMPGLDEPPFDNELGQKVYDNVSKQAWGMWTEHCKMLLNEYRLNPARREDQEVIVTAERRTTDVMDVPAGVTVRVVWAEAAVSARVEKAKPIARRGRVAERLDRI